MTLDIGGFQGRMGLFFFVLALFGFSSLTSIAVFSGERILFMRERSNGYYSPVTYFASKVLFDVIPLRVVPPFILGAIVYRPVGLVPTVEQFWQFLLILITFNLVASSVVLLISIVIADTGIANLVGSLVMLFKCVASSSGGVSCADGDFAACSSPGSSSIAKSFPAGPAGCKTPRSSTPPSRPCSSTKCGT